VNRHLLWTLTDPRRALRSWHDLLRPRGRLIVIDGIWPHDDADEPDDEKDEEEQRQAHPGDQFYTKEVYEGLPVTSLTSVDQIIDLIEAARFRGVREIDLAKVDVAEGHLDGVAGRYGLTAGR
jgi:SAM-dependent methyltransferase